MHQLNNFTRGAMVPLRSRIAEHRHPRPPEEEGPFQPWRGLAAWFLDTDYDDKTFKISQAFFPDDPDTWEKLQRALKAQLAPEASEQMLGTVSFLFEPGEHQRIAVKMSDFRGNEVVRVVKLQTGGIPYAYS